MASFYYKSEQNSNWQKSGHGFTLKEAINMASKIKLNKKVVIPNESNFKWVIK